jgi:dolichol-phosphate mannosyltransferase
MPERTPKLSIIIPVFNEGINLKIILRLLPPMVSISNEILIVHDIKNDDSVPVVKAFQKTNSSLKLVHNTLGRGVIYAVKAGIAQSKGEYVLIIAADDIGPLLAIDDMLSLMKEGCDFVNATRYAYGGKNIGGHLTSRMLSAVGNRVFRILSGSPLTDPTFGVKMFKRTLFKSIELEANPIGWAFSLEFAIKAKNAGWNLGEVPLISLNRLYAGKSTFRIWSWFKEYFRWFYWGLTHSSKGKVRVKVKIPEKLAKMAK